MIRVNKGKESSGLGRLGRWVIRHHRRVMLAWLVCFAAGGYAASQLTHRLSYDFSLPGQPAYETGVKILALYGNGGTSTPEVLVVTVPAGQSVTGDRSTIASAFVAAHEANPEVRIVDFANTGDGKFVTSDGRTTYAYLFAPPNSSLGADQHIAAAQASVTKALPGYDVGLTGIAALSTGGSSKGPSVLIETLLAGVAASSGPGVRLRLVPGVAAADGGVGVDPHHVSAAPRTVLSHDGVVHRAVPRPLVGLGVAIDYSLLLVTRWREERARGASNEDAVVRAMETAGRAVLLSGPDGGDRPGVTHRVAGSVPAQHGSRRDVDPARVGRGGAYVAARHPRQRGTALGLASTPQRELGESRVESVGDRHHEAPVAGSPHRGTDTRYRHLSGAAPARRSDLGPGRSAERSGSPPVSRTVVGWGSGRRHHTDGSLGEVRPGPFDSASRCANVSGVETAALSTGAAGTKAGYADVVVVPTIETLNSATLGPTRSVERALATMHGVVGVTGEGPGQQAFTSAVYGNVPLMLAVLAILTFLLLARALRSIILAVKAVVLNVVSLAATFGILTWFWQDGHGSSPIFSIPATGAVTFWVPITVFAFLFGLSMDYEVFILTRVREEYDAGHTTNEALVEGLGRTGRLVTSAALILFLAFISLASAPLTDVKILATGLGIGILLDATVIRALFVPSLVTLFGKRNWWFPDGFGRLFLVKDRVEGTPDREVDIAVPV